jgi:glycosyltransferase involved in cell wall biosynthesis
MRLLLVSFAFPPFNSIGGVRVGKTAKYLIAHGHDVRVLTSAVQPFPRTLPVEVPEQNVIYTRYLNVRRPVELAMRGDAQSAAMNTSAGAARSGGLFRRTVGSFVRTFVYFPDASVGWLAYAARDAATHLAGWKPDLILASSPPPTGLPLARRLSKRLNVPWVADLRDLWVDHQYYDQPRLRKTFEEKYERRILSSAAGFVTVSEPLADTLRSKYAKPTAVVVNGFDPSDFPPQMNDGHAPGGPLTIVYTGVVYEGRQDPSPLFAALKLLGKEAESVRVAFYGSFLGSVRELAERYGVTHLVDVKPPVPYKESLRLQAEADVLLLLLWTDAAERGVYTGKLFEYVGARRPILAIGPGVDVASDFIRSRDAGFVVADAEQIAALLRQFLTQKRAAGTLPPIDIKACAGVTREEQVRVLEKFLSEVLTAPHNPVA